MLQAFEMCRVGNFNCSHDSLTSVEALAALRELPQTNPALHEALLQDRTETAGETEPEFEDDTCWDGDDDGDVPVAVVVTHVVSETQKEL